MASHISGQGDLAGPPVSPTWAAWWLPIESAANSHFAGDPPGPEFGYNCVGFTAVVILVLLALAILLIVSITSFIGR